MAKLKKDKTVYRKATKDDCQQMVKLINFFAKKGLMLPKNEAKILIILTSYFVAEYENRVIATSGFKIWADSRVEIISLATHPKFQKAGIGSNMVALCMDEAFSLGFREFFTLTVRPELFSRLNFKLVDHKNLYHKVWTDCIYCPRNAGGPGDPRCNEVALTLSL